MPNYEYDCASCNVRYIKSRSMLENDPGYKCDTCNSDLSRVYSNVGVMFNGSGFYQTDNRRV